MLKKTLPLCLVQTSRLTFTVPRNSILSQPFSFMVALPRASPGQTILASSSVFWWHGFREEPSNKISRFPPNVSSLIILDVSNPTLYSYNTQAIVSHVCVCLSLVSLPLQCSVAPFVSGSPLVLLATIPQHPGKYLFSKQKKINKLFSVSKCMFDTMEKI